MSPRSAEFLDAAVRRLKAARGAVEDDPATAISASYYAMLYAVRAALSERDRYAKTHSGTWHEFRETFVVAGEFDSNLASEAQKVQPEREQADYAAWPASRAEAERVIELAARFLTAVRALLD